MMVWSLTAMLSLIKETWQVVDNIDGSFQFDSWEGYILTWIQKQCFSYKSFTKDSCSPFFVLKPLQLLKKFVQLYPQYSSYDVNDSSSFLGYSKQKMKVLFSFRNFHPTVHICTSMEDVLDLNESSVNSFDDKNIIICVDNSIPDSFGNTSESPDTLELGSNILEI